MNIYECLTIENDDDDDNIECVDRTAAIKQVPRTETAVRMNNNKMASPVRDECDDRGDDDTDKQPVVVEIRELRNTGIKKKYSSTTVVLDLDTMITINKCMPGIYSEDNASAMTVATKSSCEENYNKQIDIPVGFFDTDTTNEVEHPNKQKKYRKRKPHRH